uniref:Uncharacterized protein n=1 Tax=Micrurus paraensis TaxID=1970185 RepID=A0A2D4KEQ3_9SAUR
MSPSTVHKEKIKQANFPISLNQNGSTSCSDLAGLRDLLIFFSSGNVDTLKLWTHYVHFMYPNWVFYTHTPQKHRLGWETYYPQQRMGTCPIKRSWWEREDGVLCVCISKGHTFPHVVQGHSDSFGLLAQGQGRNRGSEGPVLALPQPHSPDPLLWAEVHHPLLLGRISGDPHCPEFPIAHFQFPKVSPRGEPITAQNQSSGIQSLRGVRNIM